MKTGLSAGARPTLAGAAFLFLNRSPWVWGGALALAAALLLTVGALLRAGREPAAAPAAAASVEAAAACDGRALHVAVDGLPTNPGTEAAPLDLATALADDGPARPCDTVWVHPGTYRGTFTSTLHGRSGQPIVVRAWQGSAPVIIDSAPSLDPAMTVRGTHARYWGLEITNSSPDRVSTENGSWPSDLERGTGVSVRGTHLAFINLRVHDMARGFEVGEEASNVEIYGCLIFHNGWEGPGASNGHGIETRNRLGTQRIRDNVIFDQYSHGILAVSSETTRVDHLVIEGNTIFNNGRVGRSGLARDLLVGGAHRVEDFVLRDNATWGAGQTFVGYGHGCSDARITGNYLVGSTALLLAQCTPEMHGNTLVSEFGIEGLPEGRNNEYLRTRPSGTVIRVRRNHYEPNLAYVAVYNWDRRPSVDVPASSLGLADGDSYVLQDVQHDPDPRQVTGVAGGIVTLPLAARPPRMPVGARSAPPSTLPEFTVFAVWKQAAAARAPAATE